jgi:RNA polymerase sigma-70 factor (ECF subfamily)
LSAHPLSAIFLSAAPPAFAGASNLEERLAAIVEAAEKAWPEVSLAPEAFLPYVALRVDDPAALASLRAADLYLACACVRRDSRAIAAFEARVLPDIKGSIAKMNLGPVKLDDVMQGLRRQLLVGEEGAAPGIAEFKGAGDLRGWLRVTATRAALKLLRKEKREVPTDDDALLARSAAAAADPELLYVKEVYRAQLKSAFQAALDSLTDREKNLLRQHVIDDLTIDDLAALYQVHRATAARWLTKARETLLVRTRKNFMQNNRIDRSECESIMRMVQSQLDGTIRRRLEDV